MIEPAPQLNSLAGEVIGAAIEVHRQLGPGFLERIYEEALAVELRLRGLPFERQAPIKVQYKGVLVGDGHVDLLVDRRLVVELKAAHSLLQIHRAQVLHYLRAADLQLGLLLNFRVQLLKDGIERIVNTR